MKQVYTILLVAISLSFAPQAYAMSNADGKGIICGKLNITSMYLGFKFGMGIVVGELGFVMDGDTKTTKPLPNHGKFLSSSDHLSWVKDPSLELNDAKNAEYHLNRKTLELIIMRDGKQISTLICKVFASHEDYETEMSRLQKIQQEKYDLLTKDNKI